jgi:hypothetical protein
VGSIRNSQISTKIAQLLMGTPTSANPVVKSTGRSAGLITLQCMKGVRLRAGSGGIRSEMVTHCSSLSIVSGTDR